MTNSVSIVNRVERGSEDVTETDGHGEERFALICGLRFLDVECALSARGDAEGKVGIDVRALAGRGLEDKLGGRHAPDLARPAGE